MFCKNCGTENEEKAKFCRSCGKEIKIIADVNIVKEGKLSQIPESSLEEQFIKNKHSILGLVIVAIILIIGFTFYWVQIRPSNIKKGCSWFTEVIPADLGIIKEQADINKKVYDEKCGTGGEYQGNGRLQSVKCFLLEKDTKERLPQSEKTNVTEATEKEYEMCLRQNGL